MNVETLLYKKLYLFVKETASDIWHATHVTMNALHIANEEFKDVDHLKLMIVSMLHDVSAREQLTVFLQYIIHTFSFSYVIENLLNIIDSVSFTKQILFQTFEYQLGETDLIILNVLRDADRIEALGIQGLKRLQDYGIERIIEHCHFKLLRLYPDGFIVTRTGREIAQPLHQEIVAFIANPLN